MTTPKKKAGRQHASRPALSTRKRIAFTVIAIALPFALLILLELALRAFTGYGGYPAMFAAAGRFDNGDTLISARPEGCRAFFPRNSKTVAGSFTNSMFREPKPKDTIRVVLVGGSAMKGFPQTAAFASSAFLRAMLSDMWPDKNVEIINLGCTAIASFPVLVITEKALAYDPDLVVICSGNNEFFGAYGVASLNTVARSPGAIALQYALRRFAIVQGADALLHPPPKTGSSGKVLMEIMVGRPYTGPDDPLRKDAARNLRHNITEMVRHCERAGVPTIVCTLPVNERDLAPLGTSKLDDLNPADQQRVRDTLDRADAALDSDIGSMLDDLREAVAAAPDHARAHWLLGRALFATGAHAEALDQFARAVDLDPMPWRATDAQNDAIRAAAKDTGAPLCDLRAAFRDASEGGSIGWNLMVDHVHYSIEGQALVARSLVKALTAFEGPLHVDPARFDAMPDWEDYAQRLGENPFERYAVAFRMRKLFDVPFYKDSNPHAVAHMDGRLRALEDAMSPTELQTVRLWQDPRVNFDFTRPVSDLIGRQDMQEGRHAAAAHLFLAAMNAMPPYSRQSLEYTYLHCRAAQMAAATSGDATLSPADQALARAAIERGQFMIANSADAEPSIQRSIGNLDKVLGDHAASIPHLLAARAGYLAPAMRPQLLELDQALAHSFMQVGQYDEALKLADWGILNAGPLIPAYQAMRAQVEAMKNAPPHGASPPEPAPPDPPESR